MNARQERRPGRPKRSPAQPATPLAIRVRHLVDTAHAGNLCDAATLTGISYPTLRELYSGAAATPNLRTLEALGAPYGVAVGWLTGAGELGTVPVVGRIGLVPPSPATVQRSRAFREVLIPYRAWPMFQLFSQLEAELLKIGATPERPIVGEASGDAFLFRLTTFLLQPMLAAEKAGATDVILVAPAGTASHDQTDMVIHWVERLRKLGAAWHALLAKGLTPA